MIFGGGHVVLPLLQAEVVPKGWEDNNTFLAGYGIAQALPGPLFSFAAYLGAAKNGSPTGWLAGLWCVFAILLPPMLLVTGLLPLWNRLRASTAAQSLLAGANATVVGILLAALYQPIWTSAIDSAKSACFGPICRFADLEDSAVDPCSYRSGGWSRLSMRGNEGPKHIQSKIPSYGQNLTHLRCARISRQGNCRISCRGIASVGAATRVEKPQLSTQFQDPC